MEKNVLALVLLLACALEVLEAQVYYQQGFEVDRAPFGISNEVIRSPFGFSNDVNRSPLFYGSTRRRCPLCDSSVYSYCSEKLFHDSCCCHNPNNPYDKLPYQCYFADCSFLHANSCADHKLITACCCISR